MRWCGRCLLTKIINHLLNYSFKTFLQTRGDVEDAWPDSQLSSRETLEVIFDAGSWNEKNHHHLRSWIVVKIYKVNNKPFPPFHFSYFEYSRATEHHQIQQLCSDYSLMDNESVFQFWRSLSHPLACPAKHSFSFLSVIFPPIISLTFFFIFLSVIFPCRYFFDPPPKKNVCNISSHQIFLWPPPSLLQLHTQLLSHWKVTHPGLFHPSHT